MIRTRIEPLRLELLEHPVYQQIGSLPALRVFMQHHVFAVWDFMTLLKALQRRLTCVEVPWMPTPHRLGCRLVNEIVLGEESDSDGHGGFASHFELYLRAMRQCGADTFWIDALIARLQGGEDIAAALLACEAPPAVVRFVKHTFSVVASDDLPALAAVFTFGREDLLPDLFERIVHQLNEHTGGELADFIFYLRRHIELDADEHGPLAQKLIASLYGDDPRRWQSAADASYAALAARLDLWNGIRESLVASD